MSNTEKRVYWTIRRDDEGKFDLGVCFDSDYEGITTGHDQCGTFPTIRDAVESAYFDGYSCPTGEDSDAEISELVAYAETEMASRNETTIDFPLTTDEVV